MMQSKLTPIAVWHAFKEISRIPRGSGNEARVADYIYNEALIHGLNCHRDQMDNVVVWVPPTEGRHDELPVIIKARLDTLCIKAEESEHEFEEEGLELIVEDGRVRAKGTSLEADNGIGVAMMMALFRDHTLSHPGLELVFATDDAMGMTGPEGLDVHRLKGRRLINLDDSGEGIVLRGIAGVMYSKMAIPVKRDALIQGEALHLKIHGLMGGHAALEMDKERDNAIQLLGRLLTEVKDESTLVNIHADHGFNRIPDVAEALITTETPVLTAERISELFEKIKMEKRSLRNARLDIIERVIEDTCCTSETFDRILATLSLIPTGMLSRDMVMGTPTFTNNLCSIVMEDGGLDIGNLTSYAFESLGETFSDRLNYLAEFVGGEVTVIGNIPVWHHQDEGNLMEVRDKAFKIKFKHQMDVAMSHDAVDHAVITNAMEGIDTITIKPDIKSAHTANESVSIASVQRGYNLLRSILASHSSH